MNCPCKGCTELTGRKIGCHSSCESYIAWKVEQDRIRESVRESKEFSRSIMPPYYMKRWKSRLKKQKGDKT